MPEQLSPSEDADWQRLIDGLGSGDDAVLREFLTRYGPLLHGIADSKVGSSMQRRFDADDVVQSTFRTFFRRARFSYFRFEDNQRLWNLLCAIMLTKIREKVRYHSRRSRSIARELTAANVDELSTASNADFVSSAPAPDAAVEFADAFANLIAGLDAADRRLVELKLQDLTNDEVAEALGVNERTVRRMLDALRGKFERLLES